MNNSLDEKYFSKNFEKIMGNQKGFEEPLLPKKENKEKDQKRLDD